MTRRHRQGDFRLLDSRSGWADSARICNAIVRWVTEVWLWAYVREQTAVHLGFCGRRLWVLQEDKCVEKEWKMPKQFG